MHSPDKVTLCGRALNELNSKISTLSRRVNELESWNSKEILVVHFDCFNTLLNSKLSVADISKLSIGSKDQRQQ